MRIVTRGDLDGLAASVLISEMEPVDDIMIVHPQDITDRKVRITATDILANLPYHPDAGMWFDHHAHTVMPQAAFKGAYQVAPSVARVIFNYYRSARLQRFAHLVDETDRFDAANLTRQDVDDPSGVILLGFLIDPRTGMSGDFRALFVSLAERLRSREITALLNDPDIRDRVAMLRNEDRQFREFLLQHSVAHGPVVVTDYRNVVHPPAGNRFLIYTVFPECHVSVRIQWGPEHKLVAVNIGHSIFNRSCAVNVGELCRNYGGGGHVGAGACVLRAESADFAIKVIVRKLQQGV